MCNFLVKGPTEINFDLELKFDPPPPPKYEIVLESFTGENFGLGLKAVACYSYKLAPPYSPMHLHQGCHPHSICTPPP